MVNGLLLRTGYRRFLHQRKRHPIVELAKFSNLCIGARLLPPKVIAGKTQHLQPAGILLLQLLQCCILARIATTRSCIYQQYVLPAQWFKGKEAAIGQLAAKAVKIYRGCRLGLGVAMHGFFGKWLLQQHEYWIK